MDGVKIVKTVTSRAIDLVSVDGEIRASNMTSPVTVFALKTNAQCFCTKGDCPYVQFVNSNVNMVVCFEE